jgi:beta-D-galactosyl-(1->4)-L-rhamnose phosphorylase
MNHNGPKKTGGFTLPGEAGYEALTLKLAKKWGADVIRDSDGTQLSDDIVNSGYDIYSTVCVVRGDNEWAKAHRNMLQQTPLMSFPITAAGSSVTVELLKGYSKEQMEVNFGEDPYEWWQVHDRTTGALIDKKDWTFDEKNGTVTVKNTMKWHVYTVGFFATRIWEEISAYNHITNNWGDREHLMPIDPIYPEVREHILRYTRKWLDDHPVTKVVRLTSMFYNFSWFWSDDPECGSSRRLTATDRRWRTSSTRGYTTTRICRRPISTRIGSSL